MSILIRGMDMPENCFDCPCVDKENGWCMAIDDSPLVCFDEKPQRCPLVEIKTPHGRLIDEKDLFEQHPGKATHHHECGFDWEITNAKEWLDKYVPTIIEERMRELKPCPFCKGQAELSSGKYGGKETSYVRCRKCGCTGEFFFVDPMYASAEKAIEAWNRRAEE